MIHTEQIEISETKALPLNKLTKNGLRLSKLCNKLAVIRITKKSRQILSFIGF